MKNMIKKSLLLLTILTTFALVGCASKNDMKVMQGQRQQDLNRISQLEAELEESKRLLKEEIEKSNDPLRARSADMWAEIQSIRAQLAAFRGELDTLNGRVDTQVGPADSGITLESMKEQVDELAFAIESQLQVDLNLAKQEHAAALAKTNPEAAEGAADATGEAASATAGVVAGTETAPASTPAVETDPAKALYDKAYNLYKEGDYEKARSYWAEFTDTFKGHPFTPSAVFWQGQCYYKLKDYARSVILFEDVIDKFKKSSKYKAALLKAGYSWNYLKKPELAKMRLQEIVEKFPKSVEATQAKRTLDKMK